MEFKPPQTPNMDGIIVDNQDNVWFSDFMGISLASWTRRRKPSPCTNPYRHGRPYGLVQDKKTGYIWYGDFSGNNITRLIQDQGVRGISDPDPRRLPRFIGLDSKGRVWFGEWWNSKLGMLDPEGSQQMASR